MENENKEKSLYSENLLLNDFIEQRNVVISGEINSNLAMQVMMILLKLEQIDSNAPINLYIDSPGGDVRAGLTIIDTIKSIKPKVNTFCYSMAASMGAVILACGDERYAFKHSTIMIHQPLSPMEGIYKQTDLSERAHSLEEMRDNLEQILCESTKGKTSIKEMHDACDKDNYLKPEDALKMGLIDHIIPNKK